jgi:hypothetical protein
MPTLDPPVLDEGDDMPSRDEHPASRRPVLLAGVAFVVAMVATVLVLLVAGAIGT